MSSSPTKTTPFRRLVFAAAPLVVLLLVWPAGHAYADIFSAFTDCFNYRDQARRLHLEHRRHQ